MSKFPVIIAIGILYAIFLVNSNIAELRTQLHDSRIVEGFAQQAVTPIETNASFLARFFDVVTPTSRAPRVETRLSSSAPSESLRAASMPRDAVQETSAAFEASANAAIDPDALSNFLSSLAAYVQKQEKEQAALRQMVDHTNRISQLPNVTIPSPTFSGTVSGLTDDAIPNDITISTGKTISTGSSTISGTITVSGLGATSTFSSGLSAASFSASNGLTLSGGAFISTSIATSTLTGGFNLTGGCFAVNGTCLASELSGWTDNGIIVALTTASDTVSLGTSTPSAKLTVWGDDTSSNSRAFEVANSASSTLLTVLNSGNVGIGTATPGIRLAVQGNAIISGDIASVANLTATGTVMTANLAASASSTIDGLYVRNATTTYATTTDLVVTGRILANTGSSTITNLTTTNATSTVLTVFSIASTSALVISTTLTSNAAGTSTFAGGASIYGISSGNGLTISSGALLSQGTATSTFTGGIEAGGLASSDGLTITAGDLLATSALALVRYLGVSTTTPSATLAVHGNALISGDIASVANLTATGTVMTANLAASASSTIDGLYARLATTTYATTTDLVVTGRILANTGSSTITNLTTTNATATVFTATSLTATNATTTTLAVSGTASTSALVVSATLTSNAAGTSTFAGAISTAGLASSNGLTLSGGALLASSALGIFQYLGISTTTPSATLAVHGNALISGDIASVASVTATGTVIAATANGTSLGVGTSSPYAKLSVQLNSGDTTTMSFSIASSSQTATSTFFVVQKDSHVGIGTAAPSDAMVHIANDIATTKALRVVGASSQSDSYFLVEQSNGNDIFEVGGSGEIAAKPTANALALQIDGGNVTSSNLLRLKSFDRQNSTTDRGIATIDSNATSITGDLTGMYIDFDTIPTANATDRTITGITVEMANGDQLDASSHTTIGLDISGSPDIALRTADGAKVGFGSSSPYAMVALTPMPSNRAPIFEVSTSTASATNTVFIINASGFVGVGTSSPAGTLAIDNRGTSSPALFIRASGSGSGNTAIAVDADDTCSDSNSSTTCTLSDIAELFRTSELVEAGDIAMFDVTNPVYLKKAVSSSSAQGAKLLAGIISTSPAIVFEGSGLKAMGGQYRPQEGKAPLALAGRVPVRVNLEGGSIAIGDAIAISSVDGIGKKATQTGLIVGYALQSFSGETSENGGKIIALVSLGQWSPAAIAASSVPAEPSDNSIIGVIARWLTDLQITINRAYLAVREIVADIITAKKVVTEEIVVDRLQMKDKITRELYCVELINGDMVRTKGECVAPVQVVNSIPRPEQSTPLVEEGATTTEALPSPEATVGTLSPIGSIGPIGLIEDSATTTVTTATTTTKSIESSDPSTR